MSEMDDNKRLGIAIGAPVVLFVGGLLGTLSGAGSSAPEAVAVSAANEAFDAKVNAGGDDALDPEVEKILYPYRKPKDVPAADQLSASDAPEVASSPEPVEVTSPEPVVAPEVASAPEPVEAPESVGPPAIVEAAAPDPASSPVSSDPEPAIAPESTAVADVDGALQVDLAAADPVEAAPPAVLKPVEGAELALSSAQSADPVEASAPAESDLATVAFESDLAGDPSPANSPEEVVSGLTTDPAPADSPVVTKPSAMDIFLASGDDAKDLSVEADVDGADPAPAAPPAADPVAAEPPAEVAQVSDPEAASPPVPTELPVVDEVTVDPSPAAPPVSMVGSTESTVKPFLGVGIRNVGNTKVTTLYSGSAAAALGLALGDELISVNGAAVTNMETLRAALASLGVGDPITVQVMRSGGIVALGPVPLSGR